MVHVEHIVCPVDFSPPSRRALDYAIGLARWYRARITALHVSTADTAAATLAPFGYTHPIEPIGMRREDWQRRLEEFTAGEHAEGVPLEAVTVEGPVRQEIVTQARMLGADLIVIGTHGRSGFERLLLGSVTERVLRHAPCPVLTVPPAAPELAPMAPGLFKKILLPTDFSPASRAAGEWAVALAQEAYSELLLLHVLEYAPMGGDTFSNSTLAAYHKEYKEWAAGRLEEQVPPSARTWCIVREFLRSGSAHRELVALASEESCDLIVMGTGRSRDLVDRVFGTTAQQVVRLAACPVLTVRAPEEKPS